MKYSEEFKIGQSSEKDTTIKDYYGWAIWIEPNSNELSEIAHVEYLLHPTFKNRLRTVEDEQTGFRLESKGWGEFMIEIIIYKKNEEQLKLSHWLTLEDNYTTIEDTNENSDLEGKKVYISYSKIDSKMATVLEDLLDDLGMEVTSGSHYQAGVPIEEYIENAISDADLVINVNSERPTAWHQSELSFAQEKSKEVISINNILDTEKVKSSMSSKSLLDDDYMSKLKTLGNNLKNLKN
ncbi:TIR domain-containing protein [Maribacter algarum]|uniref:TIR domain-containing protein n=1 Tax=Maribacter algarum (ex Zhang et al. 2020) TaxID=2578118 RepID=A0A5S3PSQ9_9FLAO|nr:pYEATS domain-containing protein [Maribacter algarum]TMM58029.1 TIR domain-containing protein [Maribacter algarum]